MDAEDARCAEARKLDRIDDAFRRGDLEALRMAVDDPAAVPGIIPAGALLTAEITIGDAAQWPR